MGMLMEWGWEVWIVSASNCWVVECVVVGIGVLWDCVFGVIMVVEDG